MNRLKKRPSKKQALIFLALLLAIGGSLFAINRYQNSRQQLPVAEEVKEVIRKAPATEEEKQTSEDSKDAIIERRKASQENTGTIIQASPVVTYHDVTKDSVKAEGFVSGVVEEGGSCTWQFSQGTNAVTKKTGTTPNAKVTNCIPLEVNRSEFLSPGVWNLVVSYDSPKAKGSSTGTSITIQ